MGESRPKYDTNELVDPDAPEAGSFSHEKNFNTGKLDDEIPDAAGPDLSHRSMGSMIGDVERRLTEIEFKARHIVKMELEGRRDELPAYESDTEAIRLANDILKQRRESAAQAKPEDNE